MPITPSDITFAPVTESDFEDFKNLRKKVMREHVDRQGLPWDEAAEDRYHRALFDTEGLRIVMVKEKRVGYAAAYYDQKEKGIIIGRLCLPTEYHNQGIGTSVIKKILDEPLCSGRKVFINSLRLSPITRLFERLGFIRTHEDEKMAYYEKQQP